MRYTATLTALVLTTSLVITAQDRMPPIPTDKMTDAQKNAVKELLSTPRTAGVSGPFVPLLRSPEFMNRVQRVGEYLRYQSPLPAKIREMTIIMTARQLTQQYEWDAHYPLAIQGGLTKEKGLAIAQGRRPEGMSDDEEMVYNFVTELQQHGTVTDPTYARVLAKFGEQGMVDIAGLVGYYSTIGMIMNVARTPAQANADTPKLAPFLK
jgi:4-carboxymuconolactone decarboxylase